MSKSPEGATEQSRSRLGTRIPSLDGLRAVSITLVIVGHLTGTQNFPRWIHPPAAMAALGVRVFFLISGFLITTLLLKEWKKTGKVSLKHFYLRRVFRIFPAFYVYLAVIIVLVLNGSIVLLKGDLIHALSYTMNYHHPHGWHVAHLWSLAVEEQFYLLWPAVLLLAGPRAAMQIAAGVILLSPFVRLSTWQLLPALRADYGQQFEAVADALASGCLLAGLYGQLGEWQRYQRFLRSAWFWCAPTLAVMLVFLDHPRIYLFAGQTALNLCILLTIERMVRYPHTPAGKLLNLPPLQFVGILSYSLYLWQQLFLNRGSTFWTAAFPLNLVLAAIMALASYYLVEQPFLKLKGKIGQGALRSGTTSRAGVV